jgi:hypothetical protein
MSDSQLKKPAARSRASKAKVLKKPPVLFHRTQAILKTVQEKLNAPLITYWNGPGGSIVQNDVVAFYECLQAIGKQKHLLLFVRSGGGTGRASLRIVHLLREYAERVTVLIPLNCLSAGTMLALGADEILMGPMAHLSAVDTSICHDLSPLDRDNSRVHVSHDELVRVVNLWREENVDKASGNPYEALYKYVHPLVIGGADRISSLSVQLCQEILSYHMKDLDEAKRIASHLNNNYPAHNYPITLKEARKVGLKASELDPSINDALIELNELYCEMGQRAITNFDEANYHDNEIENILESDGLQIFYQSDKDWHYRKEERRWVSLNDQSSWHRNEWSDDKIKTSVFHVR